VVVGATVDESVAELEESVVVVDVPEAVVSDVVLSPSAVPLVVVVESVDVAVWPLAFA
jgi:hypothetical protein